MTLLETLKADDKFFQQLIVLVCSLEMRDKKNGGQFMRMEVQDSTGQSGFPIWDLKIAEKLMASVKSGDVLSLSGKVTEYDGQPQLSPTAFSRPPAPYDVAKLQLHYDTTEAATHIRATIAVLADPWKGLACDAMGLYAGGESISNNGIWDKFLHAPAALKHHGNRLGGLAVHTSGVLHTVQNLLSSYCGVLGTPFSSLVNKDRLEFLAIVHDICKIYDYQWDTAIKWNEETLVDHRFDILAYIDQVNINCNSPLDRKELQIVKYSLLSHHGSYGEKLPVSLEDWWLHLADVADARAYEALEGKLPR
jgi:23S rRNA maturation-related 3'-5' exoribonuclease YhaM